MANRYIVLDFLYNLINSDSLLKLLNLLKNSIKRKILRNDSLLSCMWSLLSLLLWGLWGIHYNIWRNVVETIVTWLRSAFLNHSRLSRYCLIRLLSKSTCSVSGLKNLPECLALGKAIKGGFPSESQLIW